MNLETVRFSHLLAEENLHDISQFLSQTAFVISHKSESSDTLLNVLWYLPSNSPIFIVTNCPPQEHPILQARIRTHLNMHTQVYLLHQKDPEVARFLLAQGVNTILGDDGLVRDGKGEGMYLGTLCASLLRTSRWVVYYDADNLVPCALLEYTLAMGRLFLTAREAYAYNEASTLHNIRICWSSKPSMHNGQPEQNLPGRCTSVVSPLVQHLLTDWSGPPSQPMISSNAGEQAMTLETAQALRFSSGFSVETLHLLDLMYQATGFGGPPQAALLQQYRSQSPHFHTKREDAHIKQMIAVSLGCFRVFQEHLSPAFEAHLQRVQNELEIDLPLPLVYPPLQSLDLESARDLPAAYHIFAGADYQTNLLETPII